MSITRRAFGAGLAALSAVCLLPARAKSVQLPAPATALQLPEAGTVYTAWWPPTRRDFLEWFSTPALIDIHRMNHEGVTYRNAVRRAELVAANASRDPVERAARRHQIQNAYRELVRRAKVENPLIETILQERGMDYIAAERRFMRA